MTGLKPGDPGFLYLNRDDAWLDFALHQLEIVDGRLTLESRPGSAQEVRVAATAPALPSGIAIASDGAIYLTDGITPVIARIDPCDGSISTLSGAGGAGTAPGRLNEPAGLAIDPGRRRLIECDSGNGRLQFIDLSTFQLVGVMDGFDTPVDCAVDSEGRMLVVDTGLRRLDRFGPDGSPHLDFQNRLEADLTAKALDLLDPVNVAVAPDGTIALLDRGGDRVILLDSSGAITRSIELDLGGNALGLAITDRAIFIGENIANGRVVEWRRDGALLGDCPGYRGPVGALIVDASGALLVNSGQLAVPVTLAASVATAPIGCAVGGPFGGFAPWAKRWHSLRASIAALPPDSHVTFAVQTTPDQLAPPIVDPPDPFTGHFSPGSWQIAPVDLERFLIRLPENVYAWVGIQLESEQFGSPAIEQVRLDFDVPSALDYLPEIYREPEQDDALLARFLALVSSLFDDVDAGIERLGALVDPAATPDAWRLTLARWLGLAISPEWTDRELREAIATAYQNAARRGTLAGMLDSIDRYAGIDPVIEEPINQAGWWALAEASSPRPEKETSLLGVSTWLVDAEPAGAILGKTATIGRSHLIPAELFGAPLFDGLAHRFTVRVDAGLSDRAKADLDALVEREKPAHTLHVICETVPGVLSGESRVGIDSVLGNDSAPSRLGDGSPLETGTVLGGDPASRLGDNL